MELVRTADDLCAEIATKRAKAKRLSIHDARRRKLDDEIDMLVDEWLLMRDDG